LKWRRTTAYNFPPKLFDERFNEQGQACAICKNPDAGGRGAFHADHNHDSSQPRGVLCHNCNVALGNLTGLIAKIKPAVEQESITAENRNSSNGVFVENVAELNVSLSVKNILLKSPIIADMVKNGDIGIVGGIHDITTGEVKFFE
jgi:hypothetical protein